MYIHTRPQTLKLPAVQRLTPEWTPQSHRPRHQSGSTLLISLMLLLAISIISMAAIRTSLLELVIANNKQQYTNTFQAAEKEMNTRMADISLIISGTEAADTLLEEYTVLNTVVNNAIVDTTITYRNSGPSLGWDLNQGVAFHFQIDTEATITARNASSRHRSGFYIIAPAL